MKTETTSRLAFGKHVLIGFSLYAAGLVLAFSPMGSAIAGEDAAAELSSSIPAQVTGGTWRATGDLGTPRSEHTATLLPNDEVLVAGGGRVGDGFIPLASAQLYHPAIGRWQRIANMNHTHFRHTATLLPNEQVLVAGGRGEGLRGFVSLTSAELYQSATGEFDIQ